MSHLWKSEGYRSPQPIQDFVSQAVKSSSKPIVLLRPGSPYLGDAPAAELIRAFNEDAEILDAKSGPDIVGDLADELTGGTPAIREHIAGYDVLKLRTIKHLQGKALIIRSLSSSYADGDGSYFISIFEKLRDLGLGKAKLYIKAQGTEGVFLNVDALLARIEEFNAADHYTVVVYIPMINSF